MMVYIGIIIMVSSMRSMYIFRQHKVSCFSAIKPAYKDYTITKSNSWNMMLHNCPIVQQTTLLVHIDHADRMRTKQRVA